MFAAVTSLSLSRHLTHEVYNNGADTDINISNTGDMENFAIFQKARVSLRAIKKEIRRQIRVFFSNNKYIYNVIPIRRRSAIIALFLSIFSSRSLKLTLSVFRKLVWAVL